MKEDACRKCGGSLQLLSMDGTMNSLLEGGGHHLRPSQETERTASERGTTHQPGT